MADPVSSLSGILEMSLANPMGLLLGIVLSTVIGGAVILVIIEILAKKFSESVKPLNAFILAFVVSLINLFGVVSLLGGLLSMLPLGGLLTMLLPILVWIVLVKLFFREMELVHVLIISVLCYLVSIYLVPLLVGMAGGLLPV
ncbi:MAG: hypothetical protein J7K54_03065 [Candidatus Aenigmarchaeota archaeon]|nr:hypothetical protein [Candidatus Aenigmarchaeota archaeon]